MMLSVIIPSYNEEKRLEHHVGALKAFLEAYMPDNEIIIVDDGSTDRTAIIARSLAENNPKITLISYKDNKGKGYAVRTGMIRASGKLRLFTDADGATPPKELKKLMRRIEKGADIVIGSRAMKGADSKVIGKLHRKIIGTIYNLLLRLFLVRGIRDTQCGFKLFTASAADAVFKRQRINHYGFDAEILFIARKKDLAIAEVPVNWHDVPETKVRLLRDSLVMLIDIVKVRLNWILNRYK